MPFIVRTNRSMLTQTEEYALRLVFLLANSPTGQFSKVPKLAEQANIPPQYAFKVLRHLNAAGLTKTVKGVKGGTRLIKPAAQISLADVIEAIRPRRKPEKCHFPRAAKSLQLCKLHNTIVTAQNALWSVYTNTTLLDLLHNEPAGSGKCSL